MLATLSQISIYILKFMRNMLKTCHKSVVPFTDTDTENVFVVREESIMDAFKTRLASTKSSLPKNVLHLFCFISLNLTVASRAFARASSKSSRLDL